MFTFAYNGGITRTLGRLRDHVRSEGLDLTIDARPKGRMPIKARCADLFVIQVRGGLNDCAVPGLHVDPKNRQLSLDWKALFNLYFNDKVCRSRLLKYDDVSILTSSMSIICTKKT